MKKTKGQTKKARNKSVEVRQKQIVVIKKKASKKASKKKVHQSITRAEIVVRKGPERK